MIHQDTIKLADFGLSKRIEGVSKTKTGQFGMIPYFDPKKFNSKSYSLNEKSDVYSIGVLLWELSSGIPPFYKEEKDFSLIYKILEGQREEIVPDTPVDYVNLYTGKHSIYCKNFLFNY